MVWSEIYLDDQNNVQYYICKKCSYYPAIAIEFIESDKTIDKYGPFCQKHWHDCIIKQFTDLNKRLDDEDWGSSPETNREICLKCKKHFPHRFGMVNSFNGIIIDLCKECYKEYNNENITYK